ncbi:MAG TPA: DUF3782 domain-containing protein [Thermoanaerobaculia bacterium]|nr:DUF3782 domain-containing protein [Thermoanaerobaculia bacterium]
MTDMELKELVASLAVRQTDSEQRMDRAELYLVQAGRDLAESAERHKEIDRTLAESAERHKQTEQALAESAERHKQTERTLAESRRRFLAENAERQKVMERETQETWRQIRELGKQLGGLGQKFGGFTEGMAFPSMKKILTERFHMTDIGPWRTSHKNGRTMEIDVLAHANGKVDEVYVVEVKSTLREEGLEQMLRILREFHDFFPDHAGKKLYGILAAVNVPDNVRNKVLKAGIYLARIHDETFELSVPENFQPRAY